MTFGLYSPSGMYENIINIFNYNTSIWFCLYSSSSMFDIL